MDLTANFKTFTQKIIATLKEDLKAIRTGRANPALLESIVAEVYGGSAKLKLTELSTITTDGPSALIVMPFDNSTVADIERAILKSPLGLNPQTQGGRIIVRIPPLSQEQREKMLKVISQTIEEKKIMLRNQRDEVRKTIKNQETAKEITEDDKFRLEKDVDTIIQDANTEISTIKSNKETEIMEV